MRRAQRQHAATRRRVKMIRVTMRQRRRAAFYALMTDAEYKDIYHEHYAACAEERDDTSNMAPPTTTRYATKTSVTDI